MQLTLDLVGIGPMLMHNGRLANPLDPWAREVSAIAKKRKKTDDDYARLMLTEARASAYETADDLLGYPVANVWRCIYDAAKAFKQGENVKRGLVYVPTIEPLLVNGEAVKVDDYVPQHIFHTTVKVGMQRTSRARPIVDDWSLSVTFELLDDVMDARDLRPILERAGRLVGLGDWRPMYGKFDVTVRGA